MHITIATPMYGGMCHGRFMTSVFELQTLLNNNGHTMSMKFIYNESLIQRARNDLANNFLQDNETEILLFIDADIQFNAKDIYNMLLLDLDIVGAVVPLKSIHWENIKYAINIGKNIDELPYFAGYFNINCDFGDENIHTDILNNKPFEVDRIGAAVLAIKKKVFVDMSNYVDTYTSIDESGVPEKGIRYDFFPVGVVNGIFMSEDFGFCERVKKLGYKVYATTQPMIGHSGTFDFSGNLRYNVQLNKQLNQSTEN